LNNTADKFSRWEQQNVALAAVAQCAALVQKLATSGEAPQAEVVAAINPLLSLNPHSMDDIYPNIADLTLGLRMLQEMFSNDRAKENAEVVRYTLGMILLQNKLTKNKNMQSTVRHRLELVNPVTAIAQSNEDQPDQEIARQDQTFEQLARLYQDTISTLSYRIQVQGKIDILKNENIANRIRALLLAGIRSVVLWYQLGGRRWRLVFYRKRVQETAGNIRRKLLTSI